MAESANPA